MIFELVVEIRIFITYWNQLLGLKNPSKLRKILFASTENHGDCGKSRNSIYRNEMPTTDYRSDIGLFQGLIQVLLARVKRSLLGVIVFSWLYSRSNDISKLDGKKAHGFKFFLGNDVIILLIECRIFGKMKFNPVSWKFNQMMLFIRHYLHFKGQRFHYIFRLLSYVSIQNSKFNWLKLKVNHLFLFLLFIFEFSKKKMSWQLNAFLRSFFIITYHNDTSLDYD